MESPCRPKRRDSIVAKIKGGGERMRKPHRLVATDGIVAPESKKTLRKAPAGLYAKNLLARKE